MSENNVNLTGDVIKQVRELVLEHKPIAIDEVIGFEGESIPIVAGYAGHANGYKLLDIKTELDRWRVRPERRTGSATAGTLASFVDLVNRHKDEDSAIFADLSGDVRIPHVLAVIDYHTRERTPRWGKHRIGYTWPLSAEWRAWQGVSGSPMTQVGFGEFLEDHVHEVAEPTPEERGYYDGLLGLRFGTAADVLRVSRGISLTATVGVKEIVTLPSGEASVAFDESHDTKGFDGKPIKVPGLLMISVPLFQGGDDVRLPVKLRYRRRGASIDWTLSLFRSDALVRGALRADLATIAEATGLPVYEGSPEA